MKFLLIQPPLEDFYTTPIRLYPLGLLHAAAVLLKCGQDVEILDCLNPLKKRQMPIPSDFDYLKDPFTQNPYLFKHYFRFGLSDGTILNRILDSKPDYIGISSQFTAYFSSVEKLVRMLKAHCSAPVFVGGNHITAFPEEIKKRCPEIDYVLVGPAEKSIPRFLSAQIKKNEQKSIDWKYLKLPRELLQATDYKMGRQQYISLAASRGCPYRCEFCSVQNMFGHRIRYKSVDFVVEEMRESYACGARIFNFEDDNLTFNRRWFRSFLTAVLNDGALKGIELTALNGLCYPTLDGELLSMMYFAGFRRLDLSFVTQDETLRRYMRRPEPSRSLEDIVEWAQSLGFFITVYIILGLPGQTFDEVKKSIDYLLSLNVLVGPSVFYIPPASKLYDKLQIPEWLRRNWNMFRSSAFAVETDMLNREQLAQLFSYTREQNLKRKNGGFS